MSVESAIQLLHWKDGTYFGSSSIKKPQLKDDQKNFSFKSSRKPKFYLAQIQPIYCCYI